MIAELIEKTSSDRLTWDLTVRRDLFLTVDTGRVFMLERQRLVSFVVGERGREDVIVSGGFEVEALWRIVERQVSA
jgi:hypothetical protein